MASGWRPVTVGPPALALADSPADAAGALAGLSDAGRRTVVASLSSESGDSRPAGGRWRLPQPGGAGRPADSEQPEIGQAARARPGPPADLSPPGTPARLGHPSQVRAAKADQPERASIRAACGIGPTIGQTTAAGPSTVNPFQKLIENVALNSERPRDQRFGLV